MSGTNSSHVLELSLPPLPGTGGWLPTTAAITDWKPQYSGQSAHLAQAFVKGPEQAGIDIEYYRAQSRGHELISSANALVIPENWRWKEIARGDATIDWDGNRTQVARTELASEDHQLELVHFYWIDGRISASPYVGKLLQAWSRLTGQGDDAALVVLYAPSHAGGEAARESLRDFAAAMAPAIERSLLAARQGDN